LLADGAGDGYRVAEGGWEGRDWDALFVLLEVVDVGDEVGAVAPRVGEGDVFGGFVGVWFPDFDGGVAGFAYVEDSCW